MATKKVSSADSKKETVKKKAVKKNTKKVPVKKAVKTVKKVAAKKAAPKKAVAKKATPKKAAKKVAVKKSAKVKKSADEVTVDAVVEGILKLKGGNISILDLREIENRVSDYYIICEANSSTQVNAIADSVEEFVKKKTKEKPFHSEGFQNSEWILIDYVTVVVHVFQAEIREFYNLESLWADAKITRVAFD